MAHTGAAMSRRSPGTSSATGTYSLEELERMHIQSILAKSDTLEAAAKEPRRISLATLGSSPAIRETERALESLASTRKSILILGEPGTGHDIAARSLQTADAPFVVVQNGARFQASTASSPERPWARSRTDCSCSQPG